MQTAIQYCLLGELDDIKASDKARLELQKESHGTSSYNMGIEVRNTFWTSRGNIPLDKPNHTKFSRSRGIQAVRTGEERRSTSKNVKSSRKPKRWKRS